MTTISIAARPRVARIALPLIAVFLACTITATVARANPPLFSTATGQGPVAWGVEVTGGWNSYRLGAVNDTLRSLNQSLGTGFGTIRQGRAFGVALRCWARPRVLLRLQLERHSARTHEVANQYAIDPWSAGVGATYFFHDESRLRLGAGLAAGVTSIRSRVEGRQFALDSRGSGPDLRATGEAMCPLGRNYFASVVAGLRYARVPDIRLDDQSSNTPADFSGFCLRVSLGRDWPTAKNPR